MKNEDLWKQHEDYTAQTSAVARQLAFGAAAISWLFKYSTKTVSFENQLFPLSILYAICFVVAFFIADLCQYFFAALLIRFWTRRQEKIKWAKTGTIKGHYDKPAWLDYPAFFFWWLKLLFLTSAYVNIAYYMIQFLKK